MKYFKLFESFINESTITEANSVWHFEVNDLKGKALDKKTQQAITKACADKGITVEFKEDPEYKYQTTINLIKNGKLILQPAVKNLKAVAKILDDLDLEWQDSYGLGFMSENASELNEARVDVKLSTHEALEGTVARFRLESTVVNLANVADRSTDASVRDARVFSDAEIGFESAADRKKAMGYIEKAFNRGELTVDDYKL